MEGTTWFRVWQDTQKAGLWHLAVHAATLTLATTGPCALTHGTVFENSELMYVPWWQESQKWTLALTPWQWTQVFGRVLEATGCPLGSEALFGSLNSAGCGISFRP